ncbi:glycosyltransferase family 4 protein [Flavobacterium sp. ACAM 123]|uniref:glycosyltransferase family 4 protein n=1 Tax=Flavobacterium sp. ACAM 123 TaxID=1189620 RepID=UPI0002F0CFF3|nr:glycosyltransferase family 4 protein [Flavobacterium sp. ACAM 123]
MKKKILFVANIHKHFRAFHIPYIEYLKREGYEVHVAANDPDTLVPEADKQYNLPINRNPFSRKNLKAIAELKAIIDIEKYSLIHCHTAMGSVVARIAAMAFRKSGMLKVLYTAHGFHFYKGSPKLYWLLYYPMEKYLTKHTDGLITINTEDYEFIKTKGNPLTAYFRIPGIGVNGKRFNTVTTVEKNEIRSRQGYQTTNFIMIYAAEFIHRKNHQFLIEALAKHKEDFPNFKLLFCGRGQLKEEMENLVKQNNLENTITFLGYRTDIDELYKMADVGVSSSRQEGLGLNLIEEMMCGLPILATKDRGHNEIVISGENGYLFEQGNTAAFIKYLKLLYNNTILREKMGEKAFERSQKFEITNSLSEMDKIYKQFLRDNNIHINQLQANIKN